MNKIEFRNIVDTVVDRYNVEWYKVEGYSVEIKFEDLSCATECSFIKTHSGMKACCVGNNPVSDIEKNFVNDVRMLVG